MFTVSLRVAIAAAMTTVILAVAATAFTPCYMAGVGGISSTVTSFRLSIVQRVSESVTAELASAWQQTVAVSHATRVGVPDLTPFPTNAKQLRDYACHIAFDMNETVGAVAFLLPPWGQVLCVFNHSQTHLPTSLVFVADSANTGNVVASYRVTRNDGNASFSYTATTVSSASVNKSIVQYKPKVVPLMASATFLAFAPTVTYTSMDVGAPVYNASGAVVGAFNMEVRTEQMGVTLRALKLTRNSRVLVFDLHNTYVVGISWGNEEVANGTTLFRIDEMIDATFVRAFRGVGTRILTANAPFSDSIGSGIDEIFVDVADLDFHGARLRVVVVVPASDFLGGVYSTRTWVFIGLALLLAFVFVAALVFSHILTAPLALLAERSYSMAILDDSGDELPPSHFAEVRDLQSAFSTMRVELANAKKFLPQTVFKQKPEEDDSTDNSDLDNSDQSKTSKSSSTKVALESGGGLNTGSLTSRRNVSVLIVNLSGTHKMLAAEGHSRFLHAHSAALADLVSASAAHRGVVDSFHGDRIVVTFNAANNVACHQKRCALAAIAIHAALSDNPSLNRMTMGLSTGSALVGNMGSRHLMRFCTVGPVFSEAVALVRLCADYETTTQSVWALCVADVAKDAEVEVNLQAVDVLQLLGSQAVLFSVESLKSSVEDEWMYQLQHGEKSNPHTLMNQLMLRVANGAIGGEALNRELMTIPATLRNSLGYASLIRIAGG